MADSSVRESIRQYLRALKESGVPTSFAVIFGSCARGEQHEWSDIDVLVVSPKFDASFSRKDVSLLWRVAALVDSRIEPVPCGERQWTEDTASAIIEIARRQGERVLPAA